MFFTYFLCFSRTSYSNDLFKELDALNNLSIGNVQYTNQCIQENEENEIEKNEALLNKCAIDLCGPPKNNPSFILTDTNFSSYLSSEHIKKIDDFGAKVKLIAENNAKKLEEILDKLNQTEREAPVKIDIGDWDPLNRIKAGFIFEEFVDYDIDINKNWDERLQVKVRYPEGANEKIKRGIQAFAKEEKKRIMNDFWMSLGEDLFSMEELKKTLIERWNQFNQDYEKLELDFSDKENFQNMDNLRAIIKKGVFESANELGVALDELDTLEGEVYRAKFNRPRLDLLPEPCESKECREGVGEYIELMKLSSITQELKSQYKNTNNFISKNISRCKSEMALNLIENDHQNFIRSVIPRIKESLRNNLLANYSSESKKNILDFIENRLGFNFTPVPNKSEDLETRIDNGLAI